MDLLDTIIDEIPDDEKTLEDWKNLYFKLREIDPHFNRNDLKPYDKEYFTSSISSSDLNNLHRKRSISYEKIRRICKAVRQHIANKHSKHSVAA